MHTCSIRLIYEHTCRRFWSTQRGLTVYYTIINIPVLMCLSLPMFCRTHEFSWKKKKKRLNKKNRTSTRSKRHSCYVMHVSVDGDGHSGFIFYPEFFYFLLSYFILAYVFFFLQLTNSTLLQARSVIHDARD